MPARVQPRPPWSSGSRMTCPSQPNSRLPTPGWPTPNGQCPHQRGRYDELVAQLKQHIPSCVTSLEKRIRRRSTSKSWVGQKEAINVVRMSAWHHRLRQMFSISWNCYTKRRSWRRKLYTRSLSNGFDWRSSWCPPKISLAPFGHVHLFNTPFILSLVFIQYQSNTPSPKTTVPYCQLHWYQ